MAVRLRLTRIGGRKNPIWRVVVADQRSKRDGRVIETVGHYNPQADPSTIVLDGELWLGRGSAGELGHIVVKLGGRRCPCGRRGCLEAYAGRAAMERTARKAEDAGTKTKLFSIMKKRERVRLTSGVWQTALAEEDKLARSLIDEAVEALGAGVGSVQNLLDLDAVVVGGGLGSRLGQPYVERIAAAAQPHLFVDDRPPAFVLSELGDQGGGLGAALLFTEGPAR